MNIIRTSFASAMIVALPLLFVTYSHAGVVLNRAIVMFDDPSQTRQDVSVANDSNEDRLFVSVDPFLVAQPGTDEQALIPLDPDGALELLVTPNKLMIEPSGSAIVRILNMADPGAEEKYYRVNFTPMSKPPEYEDKDENEEATGMQVTIALAYQALVIVPPLDPEAIVMFNRSGKELTFTNPGNSYYLLRDGQQCDPQNADKCSDLPSKRVYPGNEYSVELPFDSPAQYSVRTVQGAKSIAVQ